MNKLTTFVFARSAAREAAVARRGARVLAFRRPAPQRLVCVWTPDPETGRLVCSWNEPEAEGQNPINEFAEPPSALPLAA
jgi:hypothetical protein